MSAAGTQNLEDILASIRQSLSDESVDGIVQLSAAAAIAARAEREDEAKPPQEHADERVLSPEEILRQRLAGALGAEIPVIDDASEAPTVPSSVADIFPAPPAQGANGKDGDGAASSDPALNKLWFVRPGAQDEAPDGATSAPLHLDPFATLGEGKASPDSGSAALFALSARAIVGDTAPAEPPPQAPAPTVETSNRHEAPRLDASQIEMIRKLKASSAAAVDSITNDETLVGLDAVAPAAPQVAEQPMVEPPTAPVATVEAAADVGPPATEVTEEDNELPASLLMRPAHAAPLFVGAYDKAQTIATGAAPATSTPIAEPQARSAADDGAEARLRRLFPNAVKEPPPAAPDSDVEAVVAPIVARAEPPAVDAAKVETAAIAATAAAMPTLDAFRAMAAAASPPSAGGQVGDRSLEDMIAAVLEPVLQRLLENSLAPLVETMVRQELEKALKARRDV